MAKLKVKLIKAVGIIVKKLRVYMLFMMPCYCYAFAMKVQDTRLFAVAKTAHFSAGMKATRTPGEGGFCYGGITPDTTAFKPSMASLYEGIYETTYSSVTFPAIARVIKIPISNVAIELVPAMGQRETVSSIAKRTSASIAINGSNYRRGGNYNGNRVNLLFLKNQVHADLRFARGSFGWNSTTGQAIIDTVLLDVNFVINGTQLLVSAINQPRVAGQAVLYTDVADSALLAYTPGIQIVINKDMTVSCIGTTLPTSIPQGGLVYQVDACPDTVQVGMHVVSDFMVRSAITPRIYNSCDFILGGAGLLVQDGMPCMDDQLYQELSQGTEIVHCGDEIAADFHLRKMQEWLIELRHPRTAIGLTSQDELCIVVVDGRQEHSEGLSLKELALFMHQLGCIQALNIGGGGCTTLCIDGTLVNSPSAGEERPVSEALCFFVMPRKSVYKS